MDLPMTVRMQEHPIVRRIAATVGSPDGVMVMPSRQSGHFLVTNRAETVLLFPEVQQLPSSFEMGAALLLRCLEPEYPSPLMSCVVMRLFLQQSVAMWGEPWASLRILPGDCVGTPVVRGRPSTHQNRH